MIRRHTYEITARVDCSTKLPPHELESRAEELETEIAKIWEKTFGVGTAPSLTHPLTVSTYDNAPRPV